MNGEELSEQIYDWLSRTHPDGPEWNKEGFHCFRDCDFIIRSIVAMDALESEISNGAWGQFLWNTYPNWREVLALAKSGYDSMDAAEQALAIDRLAEKLSENEARCAAAMARVDHTNFDQEFGNFTSIGYSDVGFKPQFAFMDESLINKRHQWLVKHADVIQRALRPNNSFKRPAQSLRDWSSRLTQALGRKGGTSHRRSRAVRVVSVRPNREGTEE